jgi:hypothetical protein
MSDEMTPERLDAILDGRQPATDDEAREMLALAGALREAAPGAGPDLRARVRALPQPQPVGRLRRLFSSGWRGRMLIAAPALSAVAAAVIAVGVIRSSSGDERSIAVAPTASPAETARTAAITTLPSTNSAPPPAVLSPAIPDAAAATGADGRLSAPITLRVASGTLEARIADIRRLVVEAGGTIGLEQPQVAPPGTVVAITLPVERGADVLKAVANLGSGPRSEGWSAYLGVTPPQAKGAAASGAPTSVRVLVTEGP